tara:strand:- start:92 stop:589 length:498 start_codon:yes stop_codon:yes gene_type:complete
MVGAPDDTVYLLLDPNDGTTKFPCIVNGQTVEVPVLGVKLKVAVDPSWVELLVGHDAAYTGQMLHAVASATDYLYTRAGNKMTLIQSFLAYAECLLTGRVYPHVNHTESVRFQNILNVYAQQDSNTLEVEMVSDWEHRVTPPFQVSAMVILMRRHCPTTDAVSGN